MSQETPIYSDEFLKRYEYIKSYVIVGKEKPERKHAVILGGPPGIGKSTYYTVNPELKDYVILNADNFRAYHPQYRDIVRNDLDHYADKTQAFANQVVERLIKDLSAEGWSLVIEGTMRDASVPIRTAEILMKNGYSVDMRMILGDARDAFQRTMDRASMEIGSNISPRYVDIDKYDSIVSSIPKSAKILQNFANEYPDAVSFTIINNDGSTEFKAKQLKEQQINVNNLASRALNLLDWNRIFDKTRSNFEEFKHKCNELIERNKENWKILLNKEDRDEPEIGNK